MKQATSVFAVLFILLSTSLYAQEQLGLKLGNYSGVQSLQLNPAWQVNGPLKWDVNIVSAGVFLEQDYLYGEKGSIVRLLNRGGEIITDQNNTGADAAASDAVPFYFENNKNYNFHQNAIAMAPSFMANIGHHSFGLYFTGRTWFSGYKIDGDLGYFSLIDSALFVGNVDPFQIGAMAWSEIGASYGRNIKSNRWMEMNAGATLKFLLGFDALSIKNNSPTGVHRDSDQIALGPADLDISYSTGYSNGTGYEFQRKGFGVAVDIGFTWLKPSGMNEARPYRWKVGVSLLDVGRIWYSRDASVYNYLSADSSYFSTSDFEDVRGPDDLISAVNSSGNTTDAQLINNKFGVWTPMAASVQFDAPVVRFIYISGTAIIGMRFPGNAIERSDLLAVTPRFETRWFEFGIPVSVYRWKELSMGTYIRMGPLTIGTENLNSWVIPGRLEGSDIYFALKIHSGMFGKTAKSRNNRKGSGCYSNM